MAAIQQHTFLLCQSLYNQMSILSHCSSALKLCTIYGNHQLQDTNWQGSILTFNLKWADGSWIGFNEVERLSIENNIQLRTGPIAQPQVALLLLTASNRMLLLHWRLSGSAWHYRRPSSRKFETRKELSRYLGRSHQWLSNRFEISSL